ncbi:hypothetical protein FisN_28Lu082 [Fistulifera solaris]|jgi:pyruvate/2-oxoglutarate dehydrogenase complex dihydrolipoamide acyltransferase (E2) component|uniref:Uncharacterized protein n=1 Tax=Fistulifera solaris TaxID=1519565 RepID=A0A1Z5KSR1_FISSO|nr:hypothetical protein FisN_28Lu082 [Fistulifera solaris]|eukprot:GAX29227.1 hypothetical protein FisN_28Lu082 [Fistulifera solaris]
MFRTAALLRKVRVTIPQLSPSHTQARIVQWLRANGDTVECYDPIFILECSPDVVTPGYRTTEDHKPLMIVETHEEGILKKIESRCDVWRNVRQVIGEIDDGDDNDVDADTEIVSEWIWQAYSHEIETDETE